MASTPQSFHHARREPILHHKHRSAGLIASLDGIKARSGKLLWQTVDLIARGRGLILFRNEMTDRPSLYLQEAWYQIHEGKQSRLQFNPGPYIAWFTIRQGPASLLLVVGGLGLTSRLRSTAWLLPALLVVVPFGVFTFAPFIVPRNMEAAIPFACLLSAAALLGLARATPWTRLQPFVLVSVTLLIVTFGFVRSLDPVGERSGFARASTYLHTQHVTRIFATSEILVFYLAAISPCNVIPLPRSYVAFKSDVAAGFRYAVLDHNPHYASPKVVSRIREGSASARYPTLGSRPSLENPIFSENGRAVGTLIRGQYVSIYRLANAGHRSGARATRRGCDPNRIL